MSGRVMTEPCDACGRTGKRHAGRGLCMGCYKRQWRQDPERAARDRLFSRVWKDANQGPNRARDRARSRDPQQRGNCDICGGLMGVSVREDGTCAGCRAELHELRWQRIEAWWAEGRSVKFIAAALGTSLGTVQSELARMREQGRSVPYRYKNTKLQRARVDVSPFYRAQEAA